METAGGKWSWVSRDRHMIKVNHINSVIPLEVKTNIKVSMEAAEAPIILPQ